MDTHAFAFWVEIFYMYFYKLFITHTTSLVIAMYLILKVLVTPNTLNGDN